MKVKLLIESIDNVTSFLRSANSNYWTSKLEEIRGRLLKQDQRIDALNDLDKLFGGMGTLNDLVFCEANDNLPNGEDEANFNNKFSELLDNLFKEMKLVNSGYLMRFYWHYLEFKHRDDLPPRIKKAFR